MFANFLHVLHLKPNGLSCNTCKKMCKFHVRQLHGKQTKVEQLNGTVYGMLSHPVADEAVRATIGQDEIVFVGSEPIRAAMLAAGAYVFSNSDRILF